MIEFYTWQPPPPAPKESISHVFIFIYYFSKLLPSSRTCVVSHECFSEQPPIFAVSPQHVKARVFGLMFFHHNVSRQCNLIILHLWNSTINVYGMFGAPVCAVYLWSFLILFVYWCKREYYLSEFKVVCIIYGELIVLVSKCVIDNFIDHLSHSGYSFHIKSRQCYQEIVWNQFDTFCSVC